MTLRIGQLAEQASVNVETIRYYERYGLLPEPSRTESGYRQYESDSVTRIKFIKRAQDLGFSLKEISGLLDLRPRSAAACEEVETKVRDKISLVDRKIKELRRIKSALQRLATLCATRAPTGDCPILDALEPDE